MLIATCHKQLRCAGRNFSVLVTRTQYGPPSFRHEGILCVVEQHVYWLLL
jgi:hypothetical protein